MYSMVIIVNNTILYILKWLSRSHILITKKGMVIILLDGGSG